MINWTINNKCIFLLPFQGISYKIYLDTTTTKSLQIVGDWSLIKAVILKL